MRVEVGSLEARIEVMELLKAAGSLRLLVLRWECSEWSEREANEEEEDTSESEAEVEEGADFGRDGFWRSEGERGLESSGLSEVGASMSRSARSMSELESEGSMAAKSDSPSSAEAEEEELL